MSVNRIAPEDEPFQQLSLPWVLVIIIVSILVMIIGVMYRHLP